MEHCSPCGGSLKLIASIEHPPVIAKILTHLGLPARAAEPARMGVASAWAACERFYCAVARSMPSVATSAMIRISSPIPSGSAPEPTIPLGRR